MHKTAPAGYYSTADETNSATLRATLHAIIDDHTRIPYTSSSTDTWNVLEEADQDPNDTSHVLDIYLNASYQKWGAGNTDYNREHSWAKSYGFPNDGSTNYPYTDCHHLFICNDSRNSSRSNKPYGTTGGSGSEYVTEANNGVGGGAGAYPGWSNWANTTYWETWWDRRGDVARALFYMDVRYEGGTHGVTGVSEPDLILTDNLSLIQNSNTGSNESTAYMGLLAVLVQWHLDDPVDAKEMAHTDAVYNYQGNRNPFVDHPEWVDCIFNGTCGGGGGGDTTPPAAPTGFTATAGDGSIDLNWGDNAEGDLAGYTVYRGTTATGPYNSVNGTLLSVSQYTDSGLTNGTTYYYVVTASDLSTNESGSSAEAGGTPAGGGGGGGTAVWINEFHYDNASGDVGEFVEVAGTAGTNLSGWSIVAYNGNGGTTYSTTNLSGTIADQQGGLGTLAFNITGLQNGAPDGLALVNNTGTVVEFLSYEGTVNATNGPASGTASTNVGVSETSSTPVGHSLQRAGAGATSGDFTWQAAQTNTSGAVNTGQSFSGGGPVNQAPTAVANGTYGSEVGASISFSAAGSSDSDGTIVSYAWTFGDGGTSTAANPNHTYAATGVYTVTLTVTDDLGAEDTDTTSASVVDTTAPGAPTGLAATASNATVDLGWTANGESDLDGYTVYRSTNSGGPYTALNGALLSGDVYTDNNVTNGTTYYYVVSASDLAGNESGNSAQVSALPEAPASSGPAVWINEFHYDDSGSDRNERVEVAGASGTSLSGWTVVAYNGNGGGTYKTWSLSGTLANQQGGFGTKYIKTKGLQNGSPDGIALVDATGTVVQFLSYEGSFTATNGPAAGMVSTDIGVSEPSSSSKNKSLQLGGTGSSYSDFTWQSPLGKTSGNINANQTFITPYGI
ncbi:MAG: endonuclease [Candidatus Krumholzibacteria bacterium]|nr:endonuclease [Candidatus Krumholzibacteria bacterium]